MELAFNDIIILLICGVIAGFINTVAGGGSLLTLPILIFMGLPSNIANGTNRIAIFMQNIFSISGYKSRGVSDFKYSSWLSVSALIGSIIGAKIAININEDMFNKILSVVIIIVVLTIIYNKKPFNINSENISIEKKIISVIMFFFIGIYGGFIHAGVGFLILSILSNYNGIQLSKANSIKVFVVFVYTFFALIVFIMENKINWILGINLGIGNSIGGWIASRWSYNKPDKIIKIFIIISSAIMAIKLWYF
ncbi:MAG: integrase [Cytophagia bacterium]|nr:integrase [Cytophagia bacterium]